ncbi:MAG: endonuclease/exonuclease/phosphatase family protein [Planctomycetota bacterium]
MISKRSFVRRLSLAFLGVLTVLSGSSIAQVETRSLRVLSYNIHHGEGTDGKLDLERIAKLILDSKADLVALQEVDKKVSRSQGVDQAAELAKLTKMHFVFGKNISFGGGEYGNAVLSRFPIMESSNRHLPNVNKGEQRGALTVRVQVPGWKTPVLFTSTHWDHRREAEEREQSAKVLVEMATDTELPQLLAGDLNTVVGSKALEVLGSSWTFANDKPLPTVSVGKPTRQIDFILGSKSHRWKFEQTQVLDEAIASDHRAFLTVVRLDGE